MHLRPNCSEYIYNNVLLLVYNIQVDYNIYLSCNSLQAERQRAAMEELYSAVFNDSAQLVITIVTCLALATVREKGYMHV